MKLNSNIRVQHVMSEPSKILVGERIVGKNKHIKNVYKKNPNAKVIKTIFHKINLN